MPHMNLYACIGHLARDPEVKELPSGHTMVKGCVAINHVWKQDADPLFVNFIAFRKTADFIVSHFSKGKAIQLIGSLSANNWVDKEGNNRRDFVLEVDRASFGDSKGGQNQNTQMRENESQTQQQPQPDKNTHQDDLPF